MLLLPPQTIRSSSSCQDSFPSPTPWRPLHSTKSISILTYQSPERFIAASMTQEKLFHMNGILFDCDIDQFRHVIGNLPTFAVKQPMDKSLPQPLILKMKVNVSQHLFNRNVLRGTDYLIYLLFVLFREISVFVKNSFLYRKQLHLLKIAISANESRHQKL